MSRERTMFEDPKGHQVESSMVEDKAGEGNMEIMQESTDHVDSFSL